MHDHISKADATQELDICS